MSVIVDVIAREILDSRGNPTVEGSQALQGHSARQSPALQRRSPPPMSDQKCQASSQAPWLEARPLHRRISHQAKPPVESLI